MKIIKQIRRFTIKVKSGFRQFDTAGITHEQYDVQPGLHPFDGVTYRGCRHAQFVCRFTEAAEARRSGKSQQVLFSENRIHGSLSYANGLSGIVESICNPPKRQSVLNNI
ncbi:hypothetical protein D3C86_1629940 [compost metagenome]